MYYKCRTSLALVQRLQCLKESLRFSNTASARYIISGDILRKDRTRSTCTVKSCSVFSEGTLSTWNLFNQTLSDRCKTFLTATSTSSLSMFCCLHRWRRSHSILNLPTVDHNFQIEIEILSYPPWWSNLHRRPSDGDAIEFIGRRALSPRWSIFKWIAKAARPMISFVKTLSNVGNV